MNMLVLLTSLVLTAAPGVGGGSIFISLWGIAVIVAIICIVIAAKKKKSQTKTQEPTSTTERVEQLTQLKDLLDSGAITQEEFDQKKKELINL